MKDNEGRYTGENPSVESDRVLYTPSLFAKNSLFYLQEAGRLSAKIPHVSLRNNLVSFLCFLVSDGEGTLNYDRKEYHLQKGDVVFIDCRKPYAHSTSEHLWSLRWCHFCGASLPMIYEKYVERGGQPVFHPENVAPIESLLVELHSLACSSDYVRDMRINEKLAALLTRLMEESWHPEIGRRSSKKQLGLEEVKNYLDEHYTDKITLDDLAAHFYMNKYYLIKRFKESYGVTVNAYLQICRVTKAKQLLRFSDCTVDEIAAGVGLGDANYLARVFRKIEGISPSEYRRRW